MLPLQDSSGLHQAPCVRPASSSPLPGPQPRTQALQTGEGHPHSWGRFSSALGCSVAFQPSPPLLAGHRWAGAWVPLGSSLFSAPALALGTRAEVFAPQQSQGQPGPPFCLSLRQLRRPWERVLSPSCPRGWRHAARAGVATGPSRRGRGEARPHQPPSWAGAQGLGSR